MGMLTRPESKGEGKGEDEGEVESWEGFKLLPHPGSNQQTILSQKLSHPLLFWCSQLPRECRRCFVMWASFVISLFTHSLSSRLRSQRNKTSNWYRQLLFCPLLFCVYFFILCSLLLKLHYVFLYYIYSILYMDKKVILCKPKEHSLFIYLFIYQFESLSQQLASTCIQLHTLLLKKTPRK